MLKLDPGLPDQALDLEYLADHLWLVGSPETVASRITALQHETRGFGYLLVVSYDAPQERESWERNLQLMVVNVLPMCAGVTT
jgi:alkanesulfonate monooxygenase SsuD/methylene tetrahydromethanopterin reductase-like flavin-dependent oxidoreductase (luciferase family)